MKIRKVKIHGRRVLERRSIIEFKEYYFYNKYAGRTIRRLLWRNLYVKCAGTWN